VKMWSKAGHAVVSVNEWVGRIGWGFVIILMSLGLYDVIMRYLFNRPSQWIYLILQMAMVALTALAGGYALQLKSFIRMDVIYSHFSPRSKAIADIITFIFILLTCVILIWKGAQQTLTSIATNEYTPTSVRLPVYPTKALIPLGSFLVLTVAVQKLISDIRTVFHKGTGRAESQENNFNPGNLWK